RWRSGLATTSKSPRWSIVRSVSSTMPGPREAKVYGERQLEDHSTMKRANTPPSAEPISIVSAADDNYAMPLAVTIRSVIDSLPKHQPLAVNILDGGLTDESKRRLARSWSARN